MTESVYSVKKVPDGDIIIFTMNPRFKFEYHLTRAYAEVAMVLNTLEEGKKAFLITDLSQVDMTFADLVLKLSQFTKGNAGTASDPRIRQNLLVGGSEMIEMAAKSLMQTQYGKVTALVFSSLDEALLYARAMLRI